MRVEMWFGAYLNQLLAVGGFERGKVACESLPVRASQLGGLVDDDGVVIHETWQLPRSGTRPVTTRPNIASSLFLAVSNSRSTTLHRPATAASDTLITWIRPTNVILLKRKASNREKCLMIQSSLLSPPRAQPA